MIYAMLRLLCPVHGGKYANGPKTDGSIASDIAGHAHQ